MTVETDPGPKAAPSTFSNKAFRSYWLAGLFANFGWNIQIVGASWVMTLIGGSPELVALVQTSVALPFLLFSLLAGALADVFGRRAIVVWSQSILVVVSAVLLVATLTGMLTPWRLLVLTFFIGTCRAFILPAWQTFINEIVSREQLPSAVSVNIAGFNIGRSVGPAIGGIIVAAQGAFAAFLVNVVANAVVLLSAMSWSRSDRTDALPPEKIGAAIAAGIRYVSLSQVQRRILFRALAFNFSASSMMSLMPLMASDLLGGQAFDYGLLFGAFGAGAVGAAFISGPFRARLSREWQAHAGFLAFAASLALAALSGTLLFSLPVVALGGVAWLLVQSGFSADIQMASPKWVMSRSQAIFQSVLFGSLAFGSWVWGQLAESAGTSAALLASAAALAGSSLIGIVLPLRDFDALDLEPHLPSSSAEKEAGTKPNNGPIITSVEYRIRREDTPAFIALMSSRKRQRTRDGAHRWTLTVDIRYSEIWVERYQLPTWTEVMRHNSRLTVFGANLEHELQTLHQGPEPPCLRYELVRQIEKMGHQTAHPASGAMHPN
jgi:MFS family permease